MVDARDAKMLRLLVVDNEPEVHNLVRNEVARSPHAEKIILYEASDESEAVDMFRRHYVDLILLDIYLTEHEPSGFEVLQTLGGLGCSADVVLMTKHNSARNANRLIQFSSRFSRPRVINFLKKQGELEEVLSPLLVKLEKEFDASAVEVSGLDFATQLIQARKDRYPRGNHSLRESEEEIAVETERICRDLFGKVEGKRRSTGTFVELNRLDRRGLSAAVTLRPTIRLGMEGIPSQSPGYDCVLKLGPVADVREEVSRYQEYVRYGVQLEQRVELLASAFQDAIGGVVYSFAGGVYGQDLASLDELLREDEELSSQVIRNLFDAVHWYSVAATNRKSIFSYMESSYKIGPIASVDANVASLRKVSEKYPADVRFRAGADSAESTFQVTDSPRLTFPGEQFLGAGWALRQYPWCLIHGDMHGGNVMAELTGESDEPRSRSIDRVCLIDYRNAGPGPRCIDAVALEASIRIADAEQIAADLGTTGASSLVGPDLVRAMQTAARRTEAERQLFLHLWGTRGSKPDAKWANLSAAVVSGLQKSFPVEKVTQDEYLATALLYTIRQLAYSMDPVTRVRVGAWLSALYSLLRANEK